MSNGPDTFIDIQSRPFRPWSFMQNLPILLSLIGGGGAVLSYVIMTVQAAFDRTHTSWISWLTSSLLAGVILTAQIQNQGTWETSMSVAQLVGTAGLFLVAAIKTIRNRRKAATNPNYKWEDNHDARDYRMLRYALVVIAVYAVVQVGIVGAILAVVADRTGMQPLISGARKHDQPFPLGSWIIDGVASLFALAGALMLSADPTQWLFPLYLVVVNGEVIYNRWHGQGWHRCKVEPGRYACCA